MHTWYDRFRAYKPPKIPPIGRVCQSILFSPYLRSPRLPPVVHTQAPHIPIRRTCSHRTPSLSSTRPIRLYISVAICESPLRGLFRCRRFDAVPAPSSPGGRVPEDMWQCVKTTKKKTVPKGKTQIALKYLHVRVVRCSTTTQTWCTSRPSSISTISSNGFWLPLSAGAFCVGISCWVGLLYGEDSEVMRVPAMLHRC